MAIGTQEFAAVRMAIRQATEVDAKKLSIYFSQIAMEPGNNTGVRDGIFPLTVSGQRKMIQRYKEQENSVLIIAEADGKILGVAGLEGGNTLFNRHSTLLHLNVRRGYRGAGIGSALLDVALDWARRQPMIRRVELEVLARNTGAIRLYERMGFVNEGYRHLAYQLPEEGDNVYVDSLEMAYYL
jgi:RimJ/RimL family protein N-acetyltransferase